MTTALSPRELAVARLIAEGYTDKQVGALLEPPINQQRVCQIVERIARAWDLDRQRDVRRQIARCFAA